MSSTTILSKKENNILFYVFMLLLLLNIVNKIIVLQKFSFAYTDSDQVIMWGGSYDFFRGQFHEPGYYGQDYNSMFEALLAAPFYKCASPAYILPIVTSLLALLPFLFISIVCYRKQLKVQALLVLALPLCLPPEYDFITSMPRGFVTGIFFAALASIFLYYQDKKWSFFFFAFFSITGYALNPNGVLITIPCGLFLLSEQYKNKSFYLQSVLGGALGAIYPLYMNYFYKKHANYIVHGQWNLTFLMEDLKVGLLNLDQRFGHVAPVYWYNSTIIILMFIAIIILFFIQKKRIWAFLAIFMAFFTILTVGINKMHDADGSIFLPFARMYLAVPFLFVLWISFIRIDKWKVPVILIVGISCISFSYRQSIMDDAIDTAQIKPKQPALSVMTLDAVEEECSRIYEQCRKFDVNLILVADHWSDSFINYGYQAFQNELPPVISPKNERRTWWLLEAKDKVYPTLLLMDVSEKIKTVAVEPGQKPIELKPLGNYMFLLQNNDLTTMELIERLKIKVRPF